jgi:hypothetical protein
LALTSLVLTSAQVLSAAEEVNGNDTHPDGVAHAQAVVRRGNSLRVRAGGGAGPRRHAQDEDHMKKRKPALPDIWLTDAAMSLVAGKFDD